LRRCQVGLGQESNEFLAAITPNYIGVANPVAHGVGYGAQA